MKKAVPFILFSFAAIAFFLYYLFPQETVEDYIESQVYQLNPEYHLSFNDLRLGLPPYIKVKNATVYRLQTPMITFSAVKARPGLAVLLKNGTVVAFTGYIRDGLFDGRVIRENSPSNGGKTIEINLNEIQLEEIEGLRAINGFRLSGRLVGKVVYLVEKSTLDKGRVDLTISECTVQLTEAPFDIKTMRFDQIEMRLTIDGRTLKVNRLDLTGSQANAQFDGEVNLKTPLERTVLDLRGNVKLHAEFISRLRKKIPAPLWPKQITGQKGLPVLISGTFKKPNLGIQ